jgi:hypothetical protein
MNQAQQASPECHCWQIIAEDKLSCMNMIEQVSEDCVDRPDSPERFKERPPGARAASGERAKTRSLLSIQQPYSQCVARTKNQRHSGTQCPSDERESHLNNTSNHWGNTPILQLSRLVGDLDWNNMTFFFFLGVCFGLRYGQMIAHRDNHENTLTRTYP